MTNKKAKKKPITKQPRKPFFTVKKSLLAVIATALITGFIFLLVYLFQDLPSPTKLSQGFFPTSTQIFDRNGVLLYEIYTDQNRTPIKIADLPEYVKQATISIEDKDFYKHRGLALRGITRAIYSIVFRKNLQGGSTITQQLIKTTLLTPERTIKRKIREAVLAWLTETIYTKDQILEMYLNHVPYGGTAYGIEQAAKSYFAKSARELNLAEAALLAGLPAAPTKYSPHGANPLLSKQRQRQVLERMTEDGYLSQEKADEAYNFALTYAPLQTNIKAPHFVMYVKDLLVEKYGSLLVEQGGLRVTTSLDWTIQQFAQDAVATEVGKLKGMRASNGAALVTKPKTGEILAMVGSKDYFAQDIDGNVNLATSLRQPGSSIKPLNYATGLVNGYTPASLFFDIPTCFTSPGQPQIYCPQNYDAKFHGPVDLRTALANSYNLPAVKMLALNGIKAMMATAKLMGISTWSDDSTRYGLSLTLGGGEVRMTEMAVAFGVFANAGVKVDLHPILKVTDYQDKLYEEFKPEEVQKTSVLIPEVTYLISDILADNGARTPMFGPNSQLVIPNHRVAVKTGTTDHPAGPRDNWTIGYTPSYLVATWVGNNDNKPMNPYLVSGVTGAAPMWHQITNFVLNNVPDEWFAKPENIILATTCTWQKVDNNNPESQPSECRGRQELFIKGTEKNQSAAYLEKKQIWIDKETNRPPAPGKTDNLELKEQLVGQDQFVKDYCFTCPHEEEKPLLVTLNEGLTLPAPSPKNNPL